MVKERKVAKSCFRALSFKCFHIYNFFPSHLSITYFNIWFEIYFGIKKWKLLKFCVHIIEMALSRINSFNFGNSYLNFTYSINCLIKTLKIEWSPNYLRKNIPNKILKSCLKFVLLIKKFKDRNQCYVPKTFFKCDDWEHQNTKYSWYCWN